MKWSAGGSAVVAVALFVAAMAGANAAPPRAATARLASALSTGGVTGADQAAIAYVDANFPGSGTASVLVTSPDTESGVAVYDVRIVAPNATTYVVHVQQSNDAVLSVNLAESQVTTTTTTVPVTTTTTTVPSGPVITPPAAIPTTITPSEGIETEGSSGTSGDGSESSASPSSSSDGSSAPSSSDGSSSSSDSSAVGNGSSAPTTVGSTDSGSSAAGSDN